MKTTKKCFTAIVLALMLILIGTFAPMNATAHASQKNTNSPFDEAYYYSNSSFTEFEYLFSPSKVAIFSNTNLFINAMSSGQIGESNAVIIIEFHGSIWNANQAIIFEDTINQWRNNGCRIMLITTLAPQHSHVPPCGDYNICTDVLYDFMQEVFFPTVGEDFGGTLVIDDFFLPYFNNTAYNLINYFILFQEYDKEIYWSEYAAELPTLNFLYKNDERGWFTYECNALLQECNQPIYLIIEKPYSTLDTVATKCDQMDIPYYEIPFTTQIGDGDLYFFKSYDVFYSDIIADILHFIQGDL